MQENSVVERDYLALIGIKYAYHFRFAQTDKAASSKGQALGKMSWYLVNSLSVVNKEIAQELKDLIVANKHGAFDETDITTLCASLDAFIYREEISRRFDEKLAESSPLFEYLESIKKGKKQQADK